MLAVGPTPQLATVAIENALLSAAVTPRDIDQKIRKAACRLGAVRQNTAHADPAVALHAGACLTSAKWKTEADVAVSSAAPRSTRPSTS